MNEEVEQQEGENPAENGADEVVVEEELDEVTKREMLKMEMDKLRRKR